MRPMRLLIAALVVATTITAQDAIAAMPDDTKPIKLVDTVDYSFGKVWNALKASMEEFGCTKVQVDKVNEPLEGSVGYSGTFRSDFCVIVSGEDSTEDVMEQYADLPRIRQGIWVTGRVQFTVKVNETGVRKCVMSIEAGLSGFEEFITAKVHFWNSNGVLENRLRDLMFKHMKLQKDE